MRALGSGSLVCVARPAALEQRQRLARAVLRDEQPVEQRERLQVERRVEGRAAEVLGEQVREEGVGAGEQRLRRGQLVLV